MGPARRGQPRHRQGRVGREDAAAADRRRARHGRRPRVQRRGATAGSRPSTRRPARSCGSTTAAPASTRRRCRTWSTASSTSPSRRAATTRSTSSAATACSCSRCSVTVRAIRAATPERGVAVFLSTSGSMPMMHRMSIAVAASRPLLRWPPRCARPRRRTARDAAPRPRSASPATARTATRTIRRVSDPRRADLALHLPPAARTSRRGRRSDPLMSPMAAGLIARRHDGARRISSRSRSRRRPGSRPTPPRSAKGEKTPTTVLCPMCHLGGFAGPERDPARRRPAVRIHREAARRLQGEAAHQRCRQHDERREHAVRRRHREPRALHREPQLIVEPQSSSAEVDRLVAELEQAEAYEQRLRQVIIDVRDQLAAGHHAAALSMLQRSFERHRFATDVVTHRRG